MLITGYKTRLATIGLMAALVGLGGAPRALGQVTTLLSGFNGDYSSSVGASWFFSAGDGWTGAFVPALSEGNAALRVYHKPAWAYGFRLSGGVPLAQLFANNDQLKFDAVTPFGIEWRNFEIIMNNNVNNWHQTGGIGISYPTEAAPFQTLTLNLTSVAGSNWKADAQAWLDAPRTNPEWFEFFFVFQGVDQQLSADFDFLQSVDGGDFLIWQQNYGSQEAGRETGNTNPGIDFDVDNDDLQQWAEQYGRRLDTLYTMIDNIRFVKNAVGAAIPEPTTLTVGLMGAALIACGARRRRGRA